MVYSILENSNVFTETKIIYQISVKKKSTREIIHPTSLNLYCSLIEIKKKTEKTRHYECTNLIETYISYQFISYIYWQF